VAELVREAFLLAAVPGPGDLPSQPTGALGG
jgi:hypothetical protein